MLMSKKSHSAIYELLFKEAVKVAKKDVHMLQRPEMANKNVPNLHVMKSILNTNQHIQDLLNCLHQPSEMVSARHTYRQSIVPPDANKKAETGTGPVTEFQFMGPGHPPRTVHGLPASVSAYLNLSLLTNCFSLELTEE
ncbi:unnamed protein product [Nyctereutes procyonoides]|uniref:Small ribosomal subunit protein eS10 n=1 Tax=Nyctereutes procyonoides TaxID=34880 RepID=A0A811YTW3_NYCPR|nr:unnamed protein product [Nyctereutes procyonoides]